MRVYFYTHNRLQRLASQFWNYQCFMYSTPTMFAVVTFYLFQQCLKEKYCQCLFRMKFLRKQKETCQTWIHIISYILACVPFINVVLVDCLKYKTLLWACSSNVWMIYFEHKAFDSSESRKFEMNGERLLKGRNFILRLSMLTCMHAQRLHSAHHFDIRAFQV